MSLGTSLASLDLNKLSSEMEKLGGGINIKRERNIAKYILTQPANTKRKRDPKLDNLLHNKSLEYTGNKFDCISEIFEQNELIPKLWAKGFNLNIINFGEDDIIFGQNSELPIEIVGNAIEANDDLNIQLSFFRISYDDESNQEFYLDLFNSDSTCLETNPTVNTLRDLNMIKIISKNDVKELLEIARNVDFGFKDDKIFGTYVLNITLFDEHRFHSNLTLVDCNISTQLRGENLNNYLQRFLIDLKLVLKEASALKLINIDTLNEKCKKKSKLVQFFFSNLLKDAKNISVYSALASNPNHNSILEILGLFTEFETICYRSRNAVNTYLSSSPNVIKTRDFIKDYEKKGALAPSMKQQHVESCEDQSVEKPRKGVVTRQSLNQSDFSVQENTIEIESTRDDSIKNTLTSKLDKTKKKVTIKEEESSFKIIERDDSLVIESTNLPPRSTKYDLKTEYKKSLPTNANVVEFKKDYVEYKRVHDESQAARNELKKENQRLENEMIAMKAAYEKEIETYRQNLMEMNTKIHLLLDKENDERYKLLIEEYEKDVLRLEMIIKNLRDQVDSLTYINQSQILNEGAVGAHELNKMRDLLRVLNTDVINKEDQIVRFKHLEREKESKYSLAMKNLEDVKSLREKNKELSYEKSQFTQQLKDLQDMYESMRRENAKIYNELQDQAITILNLTEENQALRDVISTKKIDVAYKEPSFRDMNQPTPKSGGERKSKAFESAIQDLRDQLKKTLRQEDNRIEFLIEKVVGVYNELGSKHDAMAKKQKKYLEFVSDLQDRMEEHFGKNDDLVKKCNKEIRSFLSEILV